MTDRCVRVSRWDLHGITGETYPVSKNCAETVPGAESARGGGDGCRPDCASLWWFVLVACNAWLVVGEYALNTARRWRLVELADAGDRDAAAAIRLLEQPIRLIGTVQVGISALCVRPGALGEPTFRRLVDPLVTTAPCRSGSRSW